MDLVTDLVEPERTRTLTLCPMCAPVGERITCLGALLNRECTSPQ
jgi:hypothetical protein